MSHQTTNGDVTEHQTEINPIYSTGDMARQTGNTLRTVRFYEAQGLITPFGRGSRSERLFDQSQLKRLHFITDLRALDLPLEDIREFLDAAEKANDPSSAAERLVSLIDDKLEELNCKLKMLRRVKDSLARLEEFVKECRHCGSSWDTCCTRGCDARDADHAPDLFSVLWPAADNAISAKGKDIRIPTEGNKK